MNYAIRCGLMIIACGVLFANIARAEDNDASVSDGPSRGELFEARMRAELGPNLGSLSASATRPFVLPSDVLGDAIYGIDVSHYNDENCVCKAGQKCNQCKIDWTQVSTQKVAFAYIKATQGTRYVDPTFEYHWRMLAQNKVPRGTYHFMSADEDPVEQADHFVDKLEDAGKLTPADLPPCLDLESDLRKDTAKKWIVVSDSGEKLDFWKGQEPDEILGKVLKWLNRVEQRTGRIPIIYTSRGWWAERVKDEKKFALLKRYPIWIANYPESGRPANDSPKVPNGQAWALWQFTEIGKMKNSDVLPGNLDVNMFRGTLVNFRRALGVSIADTVEVARVDDSKNAPVQQVAVNPNEPADADKPDQRLASITPNQATDAGNSAQQAAGANPTQAADANKPTQQAAGENPSQAAEAAKPAEQTTAVTSTVPADTAKPAQQTANANTSAPADANKPSQQTPPAAIAEAPAASNSAQQAASPSSSQQASGNIVVAQQATAPNQTPVANSPAQQPAATSAAQTPAANAPVQQATSANSSTPAAGANAKPPQDTNKPTEQTASIAPNTAVPQVAAANPNDTGNASSPPASATNDVAKAPAANTPKANSGTKAPSSRASRSASQRAAADKVAAEKPAADPAGEKIMIEIDLLNGRKLRVDANIDPAVLSRLIAAIDN